MTPIKAAFANGSYCWNADKTTNQKVKTTVFCQDEDKKAAIKLNKQGIPKGETLEVLRMFQNLYGVFVQVKYKTETYNLKPRHLEWMETANDK